MGNPQEGLCTTRVSVCSSSSRLSGSRVERASVLHPQRLMETLVLTAAMTLSGLLAIGSTRAVLGVLLFIAPWVLGYSALAGASWTSWIGGIFAVVVGATALPSANAEHRLAAQH